MIEAIIVIAVAVALVFVIIKVESRMVATKIASAVRTDGVGALRSGWITNVVLNSAYVSVVREGNQYRITIGHWIGTVNCGELVADADIAVQGGQGVANRIANIRELLNRDRTIVWTNKKPTTTDWPGP
jgi:hypothetical protein